MLKANQFLFIFILSISSLSHSKQQPPLSLWTSPSTTPLRRRRATDLTSRLPTTGARHRPPSWGEERGKEGSPLIKWGMSPLFPPATRIQSETSHLAQLRQRRWRDGPWHLLTAELYPDSLRLTLNRPPPPFSSSSSSSSFRSISLSLRREETKFYLFSTHFSFQK